MGKYRENLTSNNASNAVSQLASSPTAAPYAVSQSASNKRSYFKPVLKFTGAYLWGIIFTLVLWQGISLLIASPVFPSPEQTAHSLMTAAPQLGGHLAISLYRTVLGMIIGVATGYLIALCTARIHVIDMLFAPLLFVLYPIPKVVFLPVLLVLLGIADAPKIILIALTVLFQMVVTVRDALQAVDPALITSAKSLGASRFQVYTHVLVPSTLPALFTALRITSGTAVAVLFIAESIAGTSGLGYFIVNAWGLVNYPDMFAGIVVMALLGLILYEAIRLGEWIFIPHQRMRFLK